MLEWIDRRISSSTLVWGFLPIFLIHDLEEVAWTERFLEENRPTLPLPAVLKRRLTVTTREFASGVAYLFVVFSAITFRAARPLRLGGPINLFATLVSVMFLNVFTHLGQTLLLRKRTPGVVTAAALLLPYSLYTLRRLRKEGLLGQHDLRRSMAKGAMFGVPLALSAHVIGRLIARPR